MTLLHAKYDVDRVKTDVGSTLSLQIWHDPSDQSAAASGSIHATKGTQDAEKIETLIGSYDASLNATTIHLPVDDISIRTIRFTYSV
jgi:hypothetical protein